MASKKVSQVSMKGKLEVDAMEVTEETKEAIFTYDLREILREYDGKQVSLSIKEEIELPVKDEE